LKKFASKAYDFPDRQTFPDMMTVNEIAQKAGVAPDTVRYYSRLGLLKPNRNPDNGYKLFRKNDVSRLRFIRQAQTLGFTLKEITEILGDAEDGSSPCPKVRDIIVRHIEENRRKIEELQALQQRMEAALEKWKEMPDGAPDGTHVCHLIESTE